MPAIGVVYDSAGAVIWSAAYLTLGFIFFEQLQSVVGYASRMGSSLLSLVVGLFALWICWKFTQRHRFLKKLNVARITAEELRDRLEAGEDLLIVDLRTKLGGDSGTLPGALRIPAGDLTSRAHAIPRDRDIIPFCS